MTMLPPTDEMDRDDDEEGGNTTTPLSASFSIWIEGTEHIVVSAPDASEFHFHLPPMGHADPRINAMVTGALRDQIAAYTRWLYDDEPAGDALEQLLGRVQVPLNQAAATNGPISGSINNSLSPHEFTFTPDFAPFSLGAPVGQTRQKEDPFDGCRICGDEFTP